MMSRRAYEAEGVFGATLHNNIYRRKGRPGSMNCRRVRCRGNGSIAIQPVATTISALLDHVNVSLWMNPGNFFQRCGAWFLYLQLSPKVTVFEVPYRPFYPFRIF